MSAASLDPQTLKRSLLFVADEIIKAESRLNALDAALGDGDHGITMRLGFEAVKQHLAQLNHNAEFDEILSDAGLVFMNATGGAIGVIIARMLMGAAGSLRGIKEFGPAELNAMLAAMEAAIVKAGGARPGDKTILDSVHAAHAAVDLATQSQQDLSECLRLASASAEAAAESTAGMVCRIGRASRLGERSLGHPDPGAVSFSIIMRALAHSVNR